MAEGIPSVAPQGQTGDTPSERVDRAYLDLHAARERLCLAQHHVPAHWLGELDQAVRLIDQVGSSVCPQQWSKDNQPEYPEVAQ